MEKPTLVLVKPNVNVLGSKEGDNGVTVLGSLRFRLVGCDEEKSVDKDEDKED